VWGATTIISSTAYDRDGLTPTYASTYLADQDHPPILGTCPLDPAQASETVGPLEIDALETVTLRVTSWPLVWPRDQKLSRILPGLVDRTGLSIPGLLVEPDIELLIPTGSGFRRVDVLLGGAAVRVFPGAHPYGVIYRVVEPGPLDAFVRPHMSVTQRAPVE
jgi:hypothetical protein